MDNDRTKTNNQDKHDPPYTDVSNVVTGRNYIIPEDLPEGAYGAPRGKDTPVENKSTPWEKGQRSYSAFNYEFKSMHEDNPRKAPGAHNTHDNPESETQPPYEDS
ncbi:cytosolic protein [Bacillus sp. FJAT-49732]|uniref:Cytosolic protein n=1 Tax=Lederbergia citrisecunda TaxID=2833583 RepID=A0A942TNX3_9BACI|nr:cytosolic protein [Lederbergia citrisecunda]MBS4200172.1 cytosolic protein [Lederbergia citrisecunda]